MNKQSRRKSQADNPSNAELTVKIDLPSLRIAETVYSSVYPETIQVRGFRSRTLLRRSGKVLELNVKADDIVALRAASNSFLRFLAVALNTVDVVAPFYRAGRAGLNSKASRWHVERRSRASSSATGATRPTATATADPSGSRKSEATVGD